MNGDSIHLHCAPWVVPVCRPPIRDGGVVTVRPEEVEARAGMTIREVVREHKLDDIPTLCHAPELEPYGSCFVCVVELKGKA